MKTKRIQVFEYQSLKINTTYDGVVFTEQHFNALVKFNELHKNNYFTVGYKKITFKQYVGAIQTNNIVIEILPKADNTSDDKNIWQNVLITMLKTTKNINIKKVGDAHVKKQNIHLLDIYFEWYLKEVQQLLQKGLIKQYYKETKNTKALKGKLEFAGHIQKNLIHKERFYTIHQVYAKDHLIHQILNKALTIIESLTKGNNIYHACKKVQLNFPEVTTQKITETTFAKIIINKKNTSYKTALEIARFIILNYAPSIKSGKEKMFALLFDMNTLWESYILVQLKRVSFENNITISGQRSKYFWGSTTLRPDIVIKKEDKTYIIDTKWKQPKEKKASVADLRQMYTYCRFWDAEKALLLYPGDTNNNTIFEPYKTEDYLSSDEKLNHQCKLGFVSVLNEKEELSTTLGSDIWNIINNS